MLLNFIKKKNLNDLYNKIIQQKGDIRDEFTKILKNKFLN